MASTATTSQTAVVDVPDPFGVTRLYRASWGLDARAVEFLLAKGANIEAPSRDGRTLLQCAATRGDLRWARLLLSHGADPGALNRDGRQTAIACAIRGGHKAIVELLLAHGAREKGPRKEAIDAEQVRRRHAGRSDDPSPIAPQRGTGADHSAAKGTEREQVMRRDRVH